MSTGDEDEGPVSPRNLQGVHFEVDKSTYKLRRIVGYGAYGVVCAATDLRDDTPVAIKKIINPFRNKLLARRTLREIKLLSAFSDSMTIIELLDILTPDEDSETADIYLVTGLMSTDMRQVLKSSQKLSDAHIQFFISQLLLGLRRIHAAGVVHRDIKPSNLLLNEDCELRICDFGLARIIGEENSQVNYELTEYVTTRWYRAPEILLDQNYTAAIDVWSAGCVLAELLMGRALFPGKDYVHQLQIIFQTLGPPPPEERARYRNKELARYLDNLPMTGRSLRKHIPNANPLALDLLEKMLKLSPRDRITAEEALMHPYLEAYREDITAIPRAKVDFRFEQFADLPVDTIRVLLKKEIASFRRQLEEREREVDSDDGVDEEDEEDVMHEEDDE